MKDIVMFVAVNEKVVMVRKSSIWFQYDEFLRTKISKNGVVGCFLLVDFSNHHDENCF